MDLAEMDIEFYLVKEISYNVERMLMVWVHEIHEDLNYP